MEEAEIFNQKFHMMESQRDVILQKINTQIDTWKGQLDKIKEMMVTQIGEAFNIFEDKFDQEKTKFHSSQADCLKQQEKIKEILDSTTTKIDQNSKYIAFELLDNDPLNDLSVEGLCSQSEIWHDVAQKVLECQDLDTIVPYYTKIDIQFDEDFGKRLENLFFIKTDDIQRANLMDLNQQILNKTEPRRER